MVVGVDDSRSQQLHGDLLVYSALYWAEQIGKKETYSAG